VLDVGSGLSWSLMVVNDPIGKAPTALLANPNAGPARSGIAKIMERMATI